MRIVKRLIVATADGRLKGAVGRREAPKIFARSDEGCPHEAADDVLLSLLELGGRLLESIGQTRWRIYVPSLDRARSRDEDKDSLHARRQHGGESGWRRWLRSEHESGTRALRAYSDQ